jgi:hypothetical protein
VVTVDEDLVEGFRSHFILGIERGTEAIDRPERLRRGLVKVATGEVAGTMALSNATTTRGCCDGRGAMAVVRQGEHRTWRHWKLAPSQRLPGSGRVRWDRGISTPSWRHNTKVAHGGRFRVPQSATSADDLRGSALLTGAQLRLTLDGPLHSTRYRRQQTVSGRRTRRLGNQRSQPARACLRCCAQPCRQPGRDLAKRGASVRSPTTAAEIPL